MDDQRLRERLLATFRVEAGEHRQALDRCFLALEQGVDADRAREIAQSALRVMHTLKGAARSVGLDDVEAVCQATEMLLSRVGRGPLELSEAHASLLREAAAMVGELVDGTAAADATDGLIDRLRSAAASPTGAAPAERASAPAPASTARIDLTPGATIRLDARKLDLVLAHAEALLEAKLAVDARAREARVLADRLVSARHPSASHAPEGGAARALAERLDRDRHVVATAVDQLLEETRQVRLMPASVVLDAFPGMVHDLARAAGKDIEWSARGAELELDRLVLQRIKDPLVHLVRNAIDHGIEAPAERSVIGKQERGRVAVGFSARGDGRIEIRVEDDGRGLDADRLRAAATSTGTLSGPEAMALADEDVADLAFHPGLSTSPAITDVSGHGLGLAIVREEIERLGARIQIASSRAGTTVSMLVPTTIATFRGVLVRASTRQFLIPVEAVEQVLTPGADDRGRVKGRDALRWRGEALPITSLAGVLGLEPAQRSADGGDTPSIACVVTGSDHDRAALLVDEVLGDHEVLVKELEAPLVRVRHVAGVGVLGGGESVLILRVSDLVRHARRAPPAPAPARPDAVVAPAPPRVLVVDDALTTRAMERSLLEAAGYRVEVAVDGIEAWRALAEGDFDAVVSDVDMPHMDGFDLTARIRADPRLTGLPVVLVTALESSEDKQRGIDVGASAYLVKSSFGQSHLLDVIRRLGVAPIPGGSS